MVPPLKFHAPYSFPLSLTATEVPTVNPVDSHDFKYCASVPSMFVPEVFRYLVAPLTLSNKDQAFASVLSFNKVQSASKPTLVKASSDPVPV